MAAFDCKHVDVLHFLETLEVRNLSKATSEEMRFSCPLPDHGGEDRDPSCYMNTETGRFFCHGCKGKGNAITLVEQLLGVTPLEARRMLKQAYGPGGVNPDARDMTFEIQKILHADDVQEIVQPMLGEAALDAFSFDWNKAYAEYLETKDPQLGYMFERGFEAEWLEAWQFGYDPLSDRITIPVREEQGALIGFKARAHDSRHPKYLVLGDKPGESQRYGFHRYFPSKVVFGAYRFCAVDQLVICEGELNAIAVIEKTGYPAVAINGSYFQPHHARHIMARTDSVIVFLDNDLAGRNATWGWTDPQGVRHLGVVDYLRQHIDVRIATPEQNQDAASMSPAEIEELFDRAQSFLLSRLISL